MVSESHGWKQDTKVVETDDMAWRMSEAGEVRSGGKSEEKTADRPGRKAGKNVRTTLLRMLSLLAVNMYIYALVATIRTILYLDDGGIVSALIYACGSITACLSSSLLAGSPPGFAVNLSGTKTFRFIAYALRIRQMDRVIASLSSWLVIAVPAVLTFIISGSAGGLRPLFESAAVCFGYIVSLKLARKAPARILGGVGFCVGLIILVACLELHYMTDVVSYLRPWLFGALYFLIFAYLIVRNQHDIDENLYNKKFVEKSLLPKNLRRVNTVLATFVFLLVLLLSNFKTVVERLLSLVGKLVRIVFQAILRFIEQIGPDAAEPEITEITEDLMESGMEQVPPPSPYLNLVINVVQYFIVLYLAYKLVVLFILKMPAIASTLAGLFRKLFSIKTEPADDEESDYIDTSEIVLPEREDKGGRRFRKRKRRTVRHLRKIKDPAERIRYMYGLILDTLPLRGVMPLPSDTTGEILAKAGGTGGLHPFIAIYDQVRYGGMVPDQETLAKAELHYAKAYEEIRGKSV